MNFLEQLAAEWYDYCGLFVKTNKKARLRPGGGWDVELDVLAFNLKTGELIHLESSFDALSWEARKMRFLEKKFILTKEEYEGLVGGQVKSIRKIALVGWAGSTKEDLNWGQGIEVKLIPSFIQEIMDGIPDNPMLAAVPEGFPLLRAIQLAFAAHKMKPCSEK